MRQKNHLRAAVGMLKPLVMKSPLFFAPSFSLEKRLSKFSLPISFRRFFFSSCSCNTRDVSDAVEAFLILWPEDAGVGVDVLLRLLLADTEPAVSAVLLGASAVFSVAACFLRFLDPGTFLRECVKPCSASLWPRAIRRCLSSSLGARIGMMLSSV